MTDDAAPQRRGSYLGTGAVFLVGVPLVITIIAAGLWHFGIGRGSGSIGPHDTLGAFAWYGLVTVLIGWPAMIFLAVAMPMISMRLKGGIAWLVVSALVSGVAAVLSGLLIGGGGDLTEMLQDAWILTLVGGAGGLVCALATSRFRPRPGA